MITRKSIVNSNSEITLDYAWYGDRTHYDQYQISNCECSLFSQITGTGIPGIVYHWYNLHTVCTESDGKS